MKNKRVEKEYPNLSSNEVGVLMEHVDDNFQRVFEVMGAHSQKLDMLIEMVGGHEVDIQNLKDTTAAHTDLHREHERKFKSFDKRITALKTA